MNTPEFLSKKLISPDKLSEEEKKAHKAFLRERRLQEQQRLRDKHDSSFRWVLCSLLAGLGNGLGNYFLGIKLSHAGLLGPGFSGPLALILLVGYKLT